ncbi:MAG TPA: hypothetical protein VNW90_10725 [Acetobacteraceae bacterium]|jgi:hypothetical protein|nr:hypothetical protein [Acetobacteraceae bacterium]
MSGTTTDAPAPATTAAPEATPAVPSTTPAATPAAAATLPALGTPLIGDAPVVDPAAPAAADPAKPAGDVPITPTVYTDFTLPDGITKDSAAFTTFADAASKLGLPQDQAQALVTAVGERMAADAKAAGEATWQNWVDTNDKWAAEIKADPAIGGAKFDGMKVTVAKLFDDYVGHINTPERKALNEALLLTGAGNNPAIVRAIAKIAAAHTEGGFVSGSPARGPVDRAALMYPTMGQPNGAASGQQGPGNR